METGKYCGPNATTSKNTHRAEQHQAHAGSRNTNPRPHLLLEHLLSLWPETARDSSKTNKQTKKPEQLLKLTHLIEFILRRYPQIWIDCASESLDYPVRIHVWSGVMSPLCFGVTYIFPLACVSVYSTKRNRSVFSGAHRVKFSGITKTASGLQSPKNRWSRELAGETTSTAPRRTIVEAEVLLLDRKCWLAWREQTFSAAPFYRQATVGGRKAKQTDNLRSSSSSLSKHHLPLLPPDGYCCRCRSQMLLLSGWIVFPSQFVLALAARSSVLLLDFRGVNPKYTMGPKYKYTRTVNIYVSAAAI